jgi:hypothetical protein
MLPKEAAMADKTAHVFISSSGQPVIWPPVIITKKNEEVDIINLTEADIFVIYPENVFETSSAVTNKDPNKSGRPAKKGNPAQRKVANDPDKGLHRFKVFCFQTNSFAQGNSDPEFIIE